MSFFQNTKLSRYNKNDKQMNKVYLLAIFLFTSSICSCHFEDDPGRCIRYEKKTLEVGIVVQETASSMDSVKFWLGDKLVCNSNNAESSYTRNYVTCHHCRSLDSNYVDCICNESSARDSYINYGKTVVVYTCLLGERCNSETFESLHLTAKSYSHNDVGNIDSTVVRSIDLPSLNASYRIYNLDDSLVVNGIYKSFDKLFCESDFCLIQRKEDKLLCIDAESYSDVSYNQCSGKYWDDL